MSQEQTHQEVSFRIIEIPAGSGEDIPINFDEFPLPTDSNFESEVMIVVDVMRDENAPTPLWVRLVEEVWRFNKFRLALTILEIALRVVGEYDGKQHIPLLCLLANYNMALARKAPKIILQAPRSNYGQRLAHNTHSDHPEFMIEDPTAPPLIKENYWNRAGQCILRASKIDKNDPVMLDVEAAHALATGRIEQAFKLFDKILLREPTNLPALMGRARCLFGRKNFRLALKAYQTVLAYAPNLLPDPRIGIGLCFFMLGETETARAAWDRSIAVNPDSTSNTTQTLLGSLFINDSKDPGHQGGDEGRAKAYNIGIKYIETAFRIDNTTAAPCNILASLFLLKGNHEKTLKVAERAVQYADNNAIKSDAHLTIARVLQLQGEGKEQMAIAEYNNATMANVNQVSAFLAKAQAQIAKSEFPVATDILENVLRRQPQCIEALVSLAAIHTHEAFRSMEVADSLIERKKAKELYDQVLRLFAAEKEISLEPVVVTEGIKPPVKSLRISEVAHDAELYLEIAKLYSDENNLDRSLKSYKESARITSKELGLPISPNLSNNIGVLEFQRKNYSAAQDRFEEAATEAGNRIAKDGLSDELDAIITAVTFNLGVVYEALGEKEKAKGAFDQVIDSHPEFVDAKAHLALMAMAAKEFDDAHNFIKEALTSQSTNLELRGLYTYFLVETGSFKLASDFTLDTLKTHNRYDIYALCATGMLTYIRTRDNKDGVKLSDQDRVGKYLRAAEYFEKALTLDPLCAFAAQGLAISVAENTLGSGIEAGSGGGGTTLSEGAIKAKNSRDALTILTKVKESINNGSVYINIGHVHFLREEWERAIESYETASKRYFEGKNVNCLLYLSRSWFHKGNKDQNYSDLRSALEASRRALEIQPDDLSIIFNIAMIQQKGVELLYELPSHRRTLAEINQALIDGGESQSLFDKLANDKTENTPYVRGIPRQRFNYGQGLYKRSADIISTQESYEETEQARLAAAKEVRDSERKRLAEAEELRLSEIAKQAEELAEQRRVMGEESAAWIQSKKYDSDEEDKKAILAGKKRKMKVKREDGEESGEDEEKPKKKKPKAAKKSKKAIASDGSAEPEGMELDEDGEEKVGGRKRKGKAFKSSEFIEDSDSDSDAPTKDVKSDLEQEVKTDDDEDDAKSTPGKEEEMDAEELATEEAVKSDSDM